MTDHEQPLEVLRAELRRAAAAHEPDRTAMLNRIAANRGSRRTGRRQTVSLAAAAVAVAAVLGVGGIASALVAHHAPDADPAASAPATAPVTSGAADSSPSESATSRPPAGRPPNPEPSSSSSSPSPQPSASRVRGHPGDTQVEKGNLWSDGSIVPAGTGVSESTVTLKAQVDLTALDLTIRVALTPGLADQGTTHALTSRDIIVTVERRSDALLYRFVLREGVRLPAGTYQFTARYGYEGQRRDAGDDTYEAYADDADRKRPHIYGNFHATTR
ncbi:hypothetical protein WEI85_17810 [Actinomycetes bacterium KLBMP 9797]